MITFTAELTTSGILLTWDASEASVGTVSFHAGLHEDSLTEYLSGQTLTGSATIVPTYFDYRLVNLTGKLNVLVGSSIRQTSGYMPLFPGLSSNDLAILRRHVNQHLLYSRARGEIAYLYREDPSIGTACTACVDPATGDLFTLDCKVCGGTGRVDSLLGPFEIGVLSLTKETEKTVKPAAGQAKIFAQAAILSCLPRPVTGDRILFREQGRMLVVGGEQQILTSVRSVPATISVSLLDPGSDSVTVKSLLGYDSA